MEPRNATSSSSIVLCSVVASLCLSSCQILGAVVDTGRGAKGAVTTPPPPPPRAEFARTEADRDQAITAAIDDGYIPDGPATQQNLAAFTEIPLHMANDFYYLVTMKLQPGAAFNAETQGRGINVMIGSNADPTQRRDYSIYEPGVIGPGVLVGAKRKLKCETTHRVNGVVIDGCPSLIAMHLADQAQNQFTKETNLGTGNVIVQVYRHKITKAEHAKELRMEEIRVKGWNDERTEMKASMCKKCEDDYNMCRVSAGSKNCAWKYRMCAQPAREREMPTWEWCGTQRP